MVKAKISGRTRTAPSDLYILDRQLHLQRARANRLWRSYQASDDAIDTMAQTNAHQDWSDAVDDALTIAEAISRQRPLNVDELRIQFEATWWWIVEDDSILDCSARRWLRRFRRSLRTLAQSR